MLHRSKHICSATDNRNIIALAGNPNVGKSTLFNNLTGLNQHTGNWIGKTVDAAIGETEFMGRKYTLADLPGCYSLNARSGEEEIARDYIYFGEAERTVIVCDASCLERCLYLALQITEVRQDCCICINFANEAAKKGISIDCAEIEKALGIPIASVNAIRKKDARSLLPFLDIPCDQTSFQISYPQYIEDYIKDIEAILIGGGVTRRESRLLSLRLIDSERSFCEKISKKLGIAQYDYELACSLADNFLANHKDKAKDDIAASISSAAEKLALCAVKITDPSAKLVVSRLDRLFTGKITAFPIMFMLLMFILWLTIKGANYPSALLSTIFLNLEELIGSFLESIGAPTVIISLICEGVIRITGTVVSVMLPPMAIFFPLFTLLEDFGYLPRVAFNLDRAFKKCSACGKQALSMCMGFGCNAAGVVGCRIIDSPRERIIAIITNSFMPCNGRFPMLIALITLFFASGSGVMSAMILSLLIVFAVIMTLAVSKLMSTFFLRGESSAFTLELPPYRPPQLTKVIVRSVIDRTAIVLSRAIAVAAPMGALIWVLSNVQIAGSSILFHASSFLDPLGKAIGLDGVILLAFILGMPANEIVIPIILMCYTSGGTLVSYSSLHELGELLIQNGWSWLTAFNTVIFSIFHWPCSTTVLTIKKESGSFFYTLLSILIPTVIGVVICIITTAIYSLI